MFNWFFSLDITTRITVSSIHNKWLVNLLSQLWKLQYYEHKVRFKPNIHMEEFFDEDSKNPELINELISISKGLSNDDLFVLISMAKRIK